MSFLKVYWRDDFISLLLRHGAEYVYRTVEGSISSASIALGLARTSIPGRQCQLTNLKKYTRYSTIVQAYNSLGAGPMTPEVVATTLEDGINFTNIFVIEKQKKKKSTSSYPPS